MEKYLPLTAVVVEGIVVGIATTMFIRISMGPQWLLLFIILVVLLTVILKKDYRLVTISCLAAFVLAFHDAGRIQEYRIVVGLTLIIIVLELITVVANLPFMGIKEPISPVAFNGSFTFLGVVLASVYRLQSCPSTYSGFVLPNYIESMMSPVCMTEFNKYLAANGDVFSSSQWWITLLFTRFAVDFVLWFPVLASMLAAFAQTLRQGTGCNPFGWLWACIKTVFVGSWVGTILSIPLMLLLFPFAYLFQVYIDENIRNTLEPGAFITSPEYWIVVLIFLFIYVLFLSFVYGWSASIWTRKDALSNA